MQSGYQTPDYWNPNIQGMGAGAPNMGSMPNGLGSMPQGQNANTLSGYPSYTDKIDPTQALLNGKGAGGVWEAFKNSLDPYSTFMGMKPNGAAMAMPYLNAISPMMTGMAMPYMQQGGMAGNAALGQYGQLAGMLPALQAGYGNLAGTSNAMMNNPGQNLNQMGQSFHQSPGYQFQTNQAMDAANKAAAAGGMVGSPAQQQNIASTVNGLANQDYYNYLGHAQQQQQQGMAGYQGALSGISGLYGQGLQGLEGRQKQGYEASSELSKNLAQALMSQSNLVYSGVNNQGQQNGGLLGGIMGLVGGLMGK